MILHDRLNNKQWELEKQKALNYKFDSRLSYYYLLSIRDTPLQEISIVSLTSSENNNEYNLDTVFEANESEERIINTGP